MAVWAGLIAYTVAGRARRAVLRNLSVVAPELGPRARRRVAVRTFVHGAWSYAELLSLSRKTIAALPDDVQSVGWEHLEAALAMGRGVVMVGAHVGAPSLGTQLLATRGVPITIVVEQLRPDALHRFMVGIRGQTRVRLVPIGLAAAREMIAALRRNEVIGIMGDRDVAGSGAVLSFFGRATRLPTAPVVFALRTGAAILPAVAYRTGPFHAVAHIDPPVEIPRTGDMKVDVRHGTLQVTARLEALIRRCPEQWVVFSDVWPDASSTMARARAKNSNTATDRP